MSSSAVNRQTLLESVNLLPDDLLLELASFIDYLSHKSTQPVPEENASASFGVAETRDDLPSSPTLLPKEKGARIHVPSPSERGLG